MLIVPGQPPLQETRHSRELARRIDHAVREYQRDNPEVSLSDIRIALMQSTPGGDSTELARRKQVAAIVAGALAVGAFTAMASTGGRLFEGNSPAWRVVGIAVAVAAVAIALIRIARRG